MIFVLSLIVPLFASLLWIPFMGIAGLSLLAYLLMIGGVSLCIGIYYIYCWGLLRCIYRMAVECLFLYLLLIRM